MQVFFFLPEYYVCLTLMHISSPHAVKVQLEMNLTMCSPFFIQTLVGCHATLAATFLGSIRTEIKPHV